jgi:hypothetical protein
MIINSEIPFSFPLFSKTDALHDSGHPQIFAVLISGTIDVGFGMHACQAIRDLLLAALCDQESGQNEQAASSQHLPEVRPLLLFPFPKSHPPSI